MPKLGKFSKRLTKNWREKFPENPGTILMDPANPKRINWFQKIRIGRMIISKMNKKMKLFIEKRIKNKERKTRVSSHDKCHGRFSFEF